MEKKVNESNKEVIDKLMNNPSVVTALKKIIQVSKTLSSDNQQALSKKLAQMPLTKSSAIQQTRTSARKGDFFEEGKKKDNVKDVKDGEESEKEPELPLSSHVSAVKGSQYWRRYMVKLAASTDSVEKARSVFNLISSVPKQDRKFKQTLRNLLNR